MAKFEKGHAKRGGRRKGTPNKVTQELRMMVRGALERAGDEVARGQKKGPLAGQSGGEAYLLAAALDSDAKIRGAFLKLVGQTMEKQVKVDLKVRERVEVRNFTGLRIEKLKPSVLRALTGGN